MKAYASRFLDCWLYVQYDWQSLVINVRFSQRPLLAMNLLPSIRFSSGKQRVACDRFDLGGTYNGHPIIINKRSQTSLTYCYMAELWS